MMYSFHMFNPDLPVMRWPHISWLDLNCICSSFSLISLLLHLLVIGILIFLIKKHSLFFLKSIFGLLLIGLIISSVAEFLDFYHNLLVAKAGQMVFFYSLDIIQETLKALGFTIIFITLLKAFKQLV